MLSAFILLETRALANGSVFRAQPLHSRWRAKNRHHQMKKRLSWLDMWAPLPWRGIGLKAGALHATLGFWGLHEILPDEL